MGRRDRPRLDGQWLPRVHAYGLRAGAVRPDDQVGVLRRSVRHRQMLRTSAAHQMHRTRTHVVSDLTGATGMALLTAMVAGERHPHHLATLRNPHCHHDEDTIATALHGPWRAEHLCA